MDWQRFGVLFLTFLVNLVILFDCLGVLSIFYMCQKRGCLQVCCSEREALS